MRQLPRVRWVTFVVLVGGVVTLMGLGTGCGSRGMSASIDVDDAVADAGGLGAGDDGVVSDSPFDDASGGGGVDGRGDDGAGSDGDGRGGSLGVVSPCGVRLACTVRGAGPSGGLIDARPFDTLRCMASGDETGMDAVEVQMLSRPAGSRARFVDDMDGQPLAELDIAGRYLVHAIAYDVDGEALCAGTPLGVRVTPASELHVQLVWDTPRDPDQDDVCLTCGADVDLHVARGGPEWWHPVDDIYFMNRTPDWGVAGLERDDPRLDVDDVDGAGPENINFDVLGTDPVGVAVHYFDDNGWGDSFVTLRVYLYGELLFEKVGRPMVEDEFWYVGDFDPIEGTFEMMDVTWLENRNR